MQWPEFFPANCPSGECMIASGIVYRLIGKSKPAAPDFKSYRELRPMEVFDMPECIVCSLSVYTDIEDINRLKRRVPGARPKKVSRGNLNAKFGVILHTPRFDDSHHSWWLPVGVEPWLHFEMIHLEYNG